MQKNLVIVESPAKAKTIEKFLGKDFKVMSSYGHIRDLKKKEMSIDPNTLEPEYEIPEGKTAQKITFEMATDQAVKANFFVSCDGTQKQYNWDSTNKVFVAGTNTSTVVDFGDNNTLHQTYIQLTDKNLTGKCFLKFRIYGTAEVWAAFDNFTVVYEDAE